MMMDPKLQRPRLADGDLDFVVEAAAPDFKDKAQLKRLILEDDSFRKGLVGDERVFAKLMADENVFLKITPALFFEALLRRALKELGTASHTVERAGTQAVPVFDTKDVVSLLARQQVLDYLADMLSSFTRIESYVIPVRVKKGVWRKIRFNDMDIDALARMCEVADEQERLTYYKRIADVCLFILGIFPEYAHFDYQYPSSDKPRPRIAGVTRRGAAEYEEEGRKFYRLAAEHHSARDLHLTEVFWLLYENFNVARKPISFIADHYLHYRKLKLFGAN